VGNPPKKHAGPQAEKEECKPAQLPELERSRERISGSISMSHN